MVIKTELCAFSEWKIYPGRGIRYVAKDGRPFLYLSKRTRDFGLRYAPPYVESSRPRDSDGPPHGGDSTRNSNSPTRARTRSRRSSESREPSKESPLMILKKSKPQDPRTRRPSPRKL
jgi:ribosomal protein L24E